MKLPNKSNQELSLIKQALSLSNQQARYKLKQDRINKLYRAYLSLMGIRRFN